MEVSGYASGEVVCIKRSGQVLGSTKGVLVRFDWSEGLPPITPKPTPGP